MAVASAPVTCPRCGAPGVWHAAYNQWGCEHCRQLISPTAPVATSGPPPSVAVPFCPTCWSPGTWHPQAQRFGCDKCRTMLQSAPAGAPAAPIGAITTPPKASAGSIAGKVVLWIVVIVLLVVFKLAIRGML
jgi:ribosomal protein L37AE/L43A